MISSSPKSLTRSKTVNIVEAFTRWIVLISLPLILFDNVNLYIFSSKEILLIFGAIVTILLFILILKNTRIYLDLPTCLFFSWVVISSLQNPSFITNTALILYLFSFSYFQLLALTRKNTNFYHRFALVCFVVGIISSVLVLSAIVVPRQYLLAIRDIFPKSVGQVVYDYDRGRIKNLSPVDLLTPFSLLLPNFQPIPILLTLIALGASSYRSRIITGIVGVMVTSYFLKRRLSLLLFMFGVVIAMSFIVFPSSFYKRFTLVNQVDSETITKRIQLAQKAYQTGLLNPLFGVGVGNYQGYVLNTIHLQHPESPTYENPHNYSFQIMAETGIVGLMFYLIMMMNFFVTDLKNFKYFSKPEILMSISSFLFFFGSHFDWYSAHNLLYFFMLRGMLVTAK